MLGALPCDGGRRGAAAALLLSGWLQLGRALRVPAVAADDGGRTYLWHKDCRSADGLGGHVIKVRPYIGIAVQNHWTFVCNPKDWETAMHSTGNMGFLFGCNSESEVKGDLASYNSVKHLPFVTLGETDGGLAKPNTVYTTKECKSMPPWGESWHWFRKQFHLVRESDPERQHPRCWPAAAEGAPQRKNVVIAVRKGDDPTRSKHADVYLRLLGALFEGKLPDVTAVPASDAHVVIISEATEGDPDVQQLNNSLTNSGIASSFFIGAAEKDYFAARRRLVRDLDYVAARQRLVRDLDCMAQADVLVASLSGLSDLAAAVQRPPGVTLVLDGKSRRHDGIPNARKVSVQRGSRSGVESWPGELPNAVHVRFSLPEAPGAVDCPLCSRLHAAE